MHSLIHCSLVEARGPKEIFNSEKAPWDNYRNCLTGDWFIFEPGPSSLNIELRHNLLCYFVNFVLPVVQVLCRLVVNYHEMLAKDHALLNRIENVTTEEERLTLVAKSKVQKYTATLLPIRTVGVQVPQLNYAFLKKITRGE